MSTKTMYAAGYETNWGDKVQVQPNGAERDLEWLELGNLYSTMDECISTVKKCLERDGVVAIWIEPVEVEVEVEPDALVPIGTTGKRLVRIECANDWMFRTYCSGMAIDGLQRPHQIKAKFGIDPSDLEPGDSIWLRVTTEVVEGPEGDLKEES